VIDVLSRRNLPMVFQSEANECGLACLAMIRGYFGGQSDLQHLRAQSRLGGDGISVKSLLDVSDRYALVGRAIKFELSELSELRLPAILHWDWNHFVVLKKVSRKSITVSDPAVGIRHYSVAELPLHVSGIAIEFTPKPNFQQADAGPRLSVRKLLKGSVLDSTAFTKLALMSILIQAFALLTPLYLQLVIDQTILKGDVDLLLVMASCFLILFGLKTLLSYLRELKVMNLGNRLGFDLITGLAKHLFSLPLTYFERRESGDILSRFDSAGKIKQTLTQDLVTVVVDGVFSVCALLLLYWYDSGIASVVLLAVMLVCSIHFFAVLKERDFREEVLVQGAKQQSRFLESMRHVATVRVFGVEQQKLAHWEDSYVEQLNASFRLSRHQLNHGTLKSLVLGAENILVIYLGARGVISSNITLGQLMGIVFLKQHFISSVSAMIPKLAELKLLRLELDRVAEITSAQPEQEEQGCGLVSHSLASDIEFKNLSFRYHDKQASVLKKFSCRIENSQLTALVGDSGCGKSTLIRLLLKLLPLQDGNILVGGRDLSQFTRTDLRREISAVLHDDGLMAGDLAYNISLDHRDYDLHKLSSLCQSLGIIELIEKLPMGFSTQLGEMGNSFSAGLVQRILLARALYREPSILILDEALANLNLAAAKNVLSFVRLQGITTILVTHNKSLIEYADTQIRLN
jgi:ATP-binding cassette subfamily B protein RaxB